MRPLVEQTIGRPLRLAEHVIDVFALDTALNAAKDLVDEAIEREKARAVRSAIRTGHPIRLETTRAIVAPLDSLFVLGKNEALVELERAGYTLPRALSADPEHPELDSLTSFISSQLNSFSVRLQAEQDRVRVQLLVTHQGSIGEALASALLKVLGARSIAAGVVSTALFAGMGTTFEENQAIVGGWEISAVLDGGTCDQCHAHDGETFDSWDAIQELLPNGGPAVYCLGGGRCRCRAVPLPAS